MTEPSVPARLECVRRVPIFAGLPPAEQRRVASHARHVELASGQRLYGQGDRLTHLFVVHHGQVRIVRVSADGREHLIRVAGPTQVVGEYPFLTGQAPQAWVFAEQPTQLCVFDHEKLTEVLHSYPTIAGHLLAHLAQRLSDAEHRIAVLGGSDVTLRVADYLLDLPTARAHGLEGVRLPLSKKDIASYLGTTPESLSRALRRLATQGLIEVGPGNWVGIIDRPRLEATRTASW